MTDDELQEAIKDIIAPNSHIDHQNVRPHTVTFTEIGVEYATGKLLALITQTVWEARISELRKLRDGIDAGKKLNLRIGYTEVFEYCQDRLAALQAEEGRDE